MAADSNKGSGEGFFSKYILPVLAVGLVVLILLYPYGVHHWGWSLRKFLSGE